jgi:hypothetical protein
VFVPLTLTSSPSISWWNSGGYAACAYTLGIPEQGGSILFVLLGNVFITLFFFLPAVKTLILIGIISTSFSAVLVYLSLLAIFDNINYQIHSSIKTAAAFCTSLCLPFLYSIWQEANIVQVYSLGLLLTALIFYLAVKIWLSENKKTKTRYIFLIAFLIGLDFTAHRLNTPFIPVFVVLLLFPLRNQLKKIRFWLSIAGLYLLGVSFNLFLLIRSPMNPAYAMDNIQNFAGLMNWINMKQYGESNFSIIFDRRAPFWDYQVNHMYLRYFGWNFLGMQGEGTIFYKLYLSFLPLLLGAAGFIYTLIKHFKIWILIFTAFFFFSFGLIIYSNINEGFDLMREIDRLYIPSFYIFLLFSGIGLYLLFFLLYKLFIKIKLSSNLILTIAAVIGFILLPLNIFITNLHVCNKDGNHFPVDFAYNILTGCESNAILFTNGDNDTYPLWYLQTVEGIRKDVVIINLPLLNTDFYINQLQKKYKLFSDDSPVFDAEKFRPSYVDSSMIIKIPDAVSSPSDTFTIEYLGRNFGEKRAIIPQDLALISLLRKNSWQKPVYFSATVSQDNMIGLTGNLSSCGIIQKLVRIKGDSVMYRELEDNLLYKYRYRSFDDPEVYSCRTTNKLFSNYRPLFLILSQYYLVKGDKLKARQIFELMESKLPSWRFTESDNEQVQNFKMLLN